MGGLLNHLSTDPPGIISGVLQLLQDRVLGDSSRVTTAVQYELWTDSALEQLATICTAAAETAGAGAEAKAARAGAAAGGEGSRELTDSGSGADGSSSSEDAESGSESEGEADSEATDGPAAAEQAAAQANSVKQTKQQQGGGKAASGDAAAAAAAAQLVADAAVAAHELLLLLLTSPTHGLLAATAAATAGALASNSSSSSSSVSPGERRVLRLLQWLQPGHHPSHARILQAVAAAQPRLAVELLQGLSYQLEPKPCGTWLGCVAALGGLLAAAAQAQTGLKQQVQLARRCLSAWEAATSTTTSYSSEAGSSVASSSSSSSSSSTALLQGLLAVPSVDDAAVKAAVRSCLPPVLSKASPALTSRGSRTAKACNCPLLRHFLQQQADTVRHS
jgi:hypothetical protein